jgi:hypothetical protein
MDAGQSMDGVCPGCSLLFLPLASIGCDVAIKAKHPHDKEKCHKNGSICIYTRHHPLYTSSSDIGII